MYEKKLTGEAFVRENTKKRIKLILKFKSGIKLILKFKFVNDALV